MEMVSNPVVVTTIINNPKTITAMHPKWVIWYINSSTLDVLELPLKTSYVNVVFCHLPDDNPIIEAQCTVSILPCTFLYKFTRYDKEVCSTGLAITI